MPRLGIPYTLTQPVWWLAQTIYPGGWGMRPLWGGGAWGEGNLWGDGVWGGLAWGDGAWGGGVWGGADVWGGWPGLPGPTPLVIPVADVWGSHGADGWGSTGNAAWGDTRTPYPDPFLNSGFTPGFTPAEWGDLDPDPQQPGGPARYPIFGGGTCALADGVIYIYHDVNAGPVDPVQGGPGVLKSRPNTTGTSALYDPISYKIAAHAVRPVWPGQRRLRIILQWVASGVGWYDWDGVTVPAGAALYQAVADLDDTGCGSAWPTVTGVWPATVTVGGVTSPCPAAGSFTVHT